MPAANTALERYNFRNLTIANNESYDQFAIRLKRQARYCEFSKIDEAIRDQLIEKCTNIDLKRKFLKKGPTLENVQKQFYSSLMYSNKTVYEILTVHEWGQWHASQRGGDAANSLA